jgi:hypothetical protein
MGVRHALTFATAPAITFCIEQQISLPRGRQAANVFLSYAAASTALTGRVVTLHALQVAIGVYTDSPSPTIRSKVSNSDDLLKQLNVSIRLVHLTIVARAWLRIRTGADPGEQYCRQHGHYGYDKKQCNQSKSPLPRHCDPSIVNNMSDGLTSPPNSTIMVVRHVPH